MSLSEIKYSNQWCSKCSQCKTELACRGIFENIFNQKFNKIRPKWLMGYNNAPLELDGYCESLNLAFEYNGEQHYKYTPKFHDTLEHFKEQQKRDKLKVQTCKDLDITLITIPYFKKWNEQYLNETIRDMLLKVYYEKFDAT